MIEEEFIKITKELINHLMQEDYTALIGKDIEKELDEQYIKDAITEYGGEIGCPSNLQLKELVNIYETDNPDRKYVDLNLWIDGEESDLTLSFIVITTGGTIGYALKDIHIL